jgi:type I restriction enzyme S subunit
MEVNPRYKQTEVGLIPEEWEVKPLADLTTEIGDGIHSTPKYVKSSDFYFVNGNNLIGDRILITDGTMCVSESEYKTLQKNLTDRTLLLSINGTIGNLAFYNGERVVLGKSAAYINVAKRISRPFISYCLKSRPTSLFFENELTGTTIRNLSLQSLRNTPVAMPPTDREQRAIAGALGDVDALIGALTQLIAKKRDLKQAAMQQLLTGQIRLPGFSGEWEVKRLGEIGSFSKGKGLPKDELSAVGVLPAIPYTAIYTDFNEVIDRSKIGQFTNSPGNTIVINSPHLLIAGSSNMLENIGKATAFIGGSDVAVGGDIILYETIANVSFLSYLLSTRPHRKKIVFLSQGSTIRHVYASTFARYEIALPPFPEQAAIATVLSDMDAEIAALERKRDKTRVLKQGMMQELLTGRTRLI